MAGGVLVPHRFFLCSRVYSTLCRLLLGYNRLTEERGCVPPVVQTLCRVLLGYNRLTEERGCVPPVVQTGHQEGEQVEGEEDAQAEEHAHHIHLR